MKNMEPNILDSIPDLSDYKTFTDRYFSKRYIINANGTKNNDIMLMFHSNRITLISLAPSHFFFKQDIDFKINFKVGNIDRLRNVVKGKGKKGGQKLNPESIICHIEYEDGQKIAIPCGMQGTLVEINEELAANPKLLKEMPDSNGFIAIILSSIAITESTKNELLTHEDYVKMFSDTDNTDNE